MNEAPGFRQGARKWLAFVGIRKSKNLSAKPGINCETLAGKIGIN